MAMSSENEKIADCEVCGASKAKYTCPKCEVRTCCLECVSTHKKELECDGIRDKTKFIPLKSFTDLDVLSDYRLLEEVGRSVDQFKRDPLKKCRWQNVLPVHLDRLKRAAFKRNVDLQLMPKDFSRHKHNTTFLNWKSHELFWRIEWIFPQAENTKWITERVLETTRLATLVEQILDPINSLEDSTSSEDLNLRMCLSEKLQFYQAAGLNGIKALLKAEKVIQSDSKFYELDITLPLKENLENKTIIEFPTIYVILKHHLDMYKIIDIDNEDASESKNQTDTEITMKKKNPTKHGKRKNNKDTTVNYFFNGDLSESDEEIANNSKQRHKYSNLNIPAYDELVKMEY